MYFSSSVVFDPKIEYETQKSRLRRIWRYKRWYSEAIKRRRITKIKKRPQKRQIDNQWSTKHYTENRMLGNTNITKIRGETLITLSFGWLIDFLVSNATFSNISTISWRPVLVLEEAGVPRENHRLWTSNW